MNDLETKKEPVSTDVLAKQGVAAVAQIAGGIIILIMHIFSAKLLPLGLVFGLVIGGIGIGGILSKDPEGKKPGILLAIAGGLKLLFHSHIPLLAPVAGTLLNVASMGLLALGLFNGYRFLKGLKSRS